MNKMREMLAILALVLCYVVPAAAHESFQMFPPMQSAPPLDRRPLKSVAPGNGGTSLLVPLYIYPSSASVWLPLVTAKGLNTSARIIAIVNPASGPGTTTDPNYTAGIAQLQAANIITYGYVDTANCTDTLASVEANILLWTTLYSLGTNPGIFLDDMTNVTGCESYYTSLTAYAHSLGFNTVIGNPGTDTLNSYVPTVDALVIWESSALPTVSYVSVGVAPKFRQDYNKRHYGAISYGIASFVSSTFQALCQYVGYIYLNDDVSYGTFPSYLNTMVEAL
jgi:Spherulation-specific family 4